MKLPLCLICGRKILYTDGIYRLTDDPYIINGESTGIKYIGFEEIGEYYSGASFFNQAVIDEKCRNIAKITGGGTLLDLACGDGLYTIPLLGRGLSIIAMDISDKMLALLYKRAENSGADISNLVVCRANALDIPLADGSVDAVTAISLLHLISRPEAVIGEIYRVLKKGGEYITFEDRPGADIFSNKNLSAGEQAENIKYSEITDFIERRYFKILEEEHGISRTRYSWFFDQKNICGEIFDSKKIYTVPIDSKTRNILKDSYLYRMRGKGYSNQSAVPRDIHEDAFRRVMAEFTELYGAEAPDTGYTEYENDVEITVYIK